MQSMPTPRVARHPRLFENLRRLSKQRAFPVSQCESQGMAEDDDPRRHTHAYV